MRETRSFQNILIQTKLNRPTISKNWVLRPQLISRMNEGLKKRVTLVSAPAGAGKTTLAVQWLGQTSRPPAWLSLDRNDNDLGRFLRYLIAAIKTVCEKFASDHEPTFFSANMPPPDYLADALISEMCRIQGSIVLVLDDYQYVTSEEVQTIICRIIEYEFENVHMLILTRSDPPWPIGLWRVRDWLNELRAKDLLFSREETKAFFDIAKIKSLDPEVMNMLQSRTEGWIAALKMAEISLASVEDPEQFARNFSGNDRMVADFLIDEVVSHQPSEIQEFLAVTAMLDRFCQSLCSFLWADPGTEPDPGRILPQLEAGNMFLIPLDNERRWYRYHHLFQGLLLNHTKEKLAPEYRIRIHQRAGTWFAEQNLVEEALQHFLLAGDVNTAALLIKNNLHSVIDEDLSRRILGRWLNMFPESEDDNHPALVVARGYQCLFNWNLSRLSGLLDRAEAMLGDSSHSISDQIQRDLEGDIHALCAYRRFWEGDAECALTHAQKALELVPEEHLYARGLAVVYAGGSYALTGRREESLNLFADALSKDCSSGSRNAGVFLTGLAAVHCFAGDLHSIEKTAKTILSTHETAPISQYWHGYALYFLGWAAYERNHLEAAGQYFSRLEAIRYQVNTRVYNSNLIGLALVARANGENHEAYECIASARRFSVETRDSVSHEITDLFEQWLNAMCGKLSSESATFPKTVDSNRFWIEVRSLLAAELLIRRQNSRDCEKALEIVEESLQRAERHHNIRQVIQFHALKAVGLKGAGKPNDGIEALENALRLARPLGFVRTFMDRGPIMVELLEAIHNKRPGDSYVRRLLDAFANEMPSPESEPAAAGDPEQARNALLEGEVRPRLSNRELEVLKLLSKRLASKEIAERLFISPQTVRKHEYNIFRKLHVHGRREAIVKVRTLHLFPDK